MIFYVPESNLALQAISSTELVLSTLLAGPIILVSAKMINLRTLDIKVRELYELLLTKTAYDVSIISFFCTIIVLIGFCVRHRWFKTSFFHKYTFIFVGVQLILEIWTIATDYLDYPLLSNWSALLDIGTNENQFTRKIVSIFLGGIFLAFTTRTWASSLSIALMITICYSNQSAQRYAWIYHIYGWMMPICLSLMIYFLSSNEIFVIGAKRFGRVQIILTIVLLALCILINTINLLRIVRRTYRLRRNTRSNSEVIEERPLTVNEEGGEIVDQSCPSR